MLGDIHTLNLWMFPVIGIFGFLFCFFRYKFVWWVVPIVILICIAFTYELRERDWDLIRDIPVRSVVLSMLFAVLLPVVGALIDFERRKLGRSEISS